MGEWDRLWDEHSHLLDRMMSAAQKEFVSVDMNTVRVRLTVKMLWRLFCGSTIRFKANETDIILTRK
jgi:Ni,Fe-hydrogenase III large subunit